jgi:hypothetical protein
MNSDNTEERGDRASNERKAPPQGSLLFTWVCAAVATWFLLPSRSISIALTAALLGGLAVAFAQLYIRTPSKDILRELSIIVCCSMFGVVPAARRLLAHGTDSEQIVQASFYAVGVGILLLTVDILARRRESGTRWLSTLGIVTVVVASATPLWLMRSSDAALGITALAHTSIAPTVALACWLASLRWPRLEWLLGALLFGATVPALTFMKLESFMALGGFGFVIYVALQVLVVFAARRFLHSANMSSTVE